MPVPLVPDGLPALAELGVPVPAYDRAAVRAGTVHLGVGAFHRAHQAGFHDALLSAGEDGWGICGIGVLEGDRPVLDALRAQDGLYTIVEKHPDGTTAPRVCGALVELLLAPDDPQAAARRLADPGVHRVSMTITETGYPVDEAGEFAPERARLDVFELLVEGLARRRAAGGPAPVVVSCDNLPGNGAVARTATVGVARRRDPALAAWIGAEVAFPSSMVDRITPRTTDLDRQALRVVVGIDDAVPVMCEPFRAWVLETAEGLEPLARAGVQLVADAAPHERMKLRLLNAGHQVLAYAGQVVGATRVAEAVRDPEVLALLEAFWDREAIPSLSGVPAADVVAFRAALPGRFANRALPDTLERLAVDGAERLAAFVVPVLRDRLRAGAPVGCSVAAVALRAWATGAAQGPEAEPCAVALGDLAAHEHVRALHASVLADLRDGGPRHALVRAAAGPV